mgnify:CR=1 FL=1|jgi:hypothetical protein
MQEYKNYNSAKIREEARAKLSASQQLSALDKRLGKDNGAAKERLRLHQQIASEKK